jgi:hypothetical protein
MSSRRQQLFSLAASWLGRLHGQRSRGLPWALSEQMMMRLAERHLAEQVPSEARQVYVHCLARLVLAAIGGALWYDAHVSTDRDGSPAIPQMNETASASLIGFRIQQPERSQ